MVTYKKPVGAADSFLRPSRTYHDFELESGINKKVNCLIAFAAVALIVALAALSLAIMLLFQAFQTAEIEVDKLTVLQQRIKQLEDKIEQNSSNVKVVLPSNIDHPITIEGKSGGNVTPEYAATKDVFRILTPSETHPEEAEDTEHESNERTQGPPLNSTTPGESPGVAEEEKKVIDTRDDCPPYPRHICPVGYTLQNTDDPCPRPVCHPGDDEEDYEGSGE